MIVQSNVVKMIVVSMELVQMEFVIVIHNLTEKTVHIKLVSGTVMEMELVNQDHVLVMKVGLDNIVKNKYV